MSEKLCLGCMETYNEKYNTCPYCGYEEGTPPKEAYHLVPGTTIKDKYIVGKVIGYGGFGVTYLGYDSVLNQKVAIKEYLPGEFATRVTGASDVTIFSGERQEQFADGIVKFVDEARRLAKFRNTSGIVRIFDSFTANHTAYIVMEYLEGETLKEKLAREGKMPVDEALNLMMPVIKALSEVHKEGILHRDISPDNIFVTKYGEVKLLDFGAARYATTTHSKSLSVIVKPGYAPQEQYRSRGDQGTWTDVYACAATLYKMITGVTPEESMERGNRDTLVPPSKLGIKIPKNKENAIMNALNLKIEDRTQTAEAFEADLTTENDVKRNKIRFKKMDVGKWPLWLKITSGAAAAAITAFIVLLMTGVIQFADLFHSDSGNLEKGYVYAPEVRNMELAKAETIINEKNLITQIIDKKNDDEIPKDFILSQNIPTGEVIQERTVIEITVSAGREIEYITETTGMSQEEAVKLLEALGFEVEVVEEESDEVAPGYITGQTDENGNILENGTELEKGAKVFIHVSKGNDKFDNNKNTTVPDVAGENWGTAKKRMTNAKLYIYRAGSDYSDTVPEGHVISQKTGAGTEVPEGTSIGVVISLGKQSERKTRVPDVTYKSRTEAERLLSEAGLTVNVQYEDSQTVAKDGVIRQSEAAGTELTYGATVTIWVSRGNPEAESAPKYEPTTEAPIGEESKPDPKPTTTEKPTDTGTEAQKPDPEPTPKPDPEPTKIYVKSITLNNTSKTLLTGNSFSLSATIAPTNATNQSVSWSSSNSGVASVSSDGAVTAVSAGTATITASANDGSGVKASCTVTVEKPDPDAGKVAVPNLVNKSEAQAKSELESLGLALGTVTYKHNESYSTGTVTSQTTAAGQKVVKGTSVNIVVCNNTKEYKYAKITTETKESTSSSLSGWTQTGSYIKWGSWSEETTNPGTASETREIRETRRGEPYTYLDDPCLAIYGESHQLPTSAGLTVKGHSGSSVCWIQYFLNWKYGVIGCTGTFDDATEQEVMKYQREKGLSADGKVGSGTGSAMENEWREGTKTATVYYQYRTGVKTYQYSREVTGSWSGWSTTKPLGSNIKLEERYKY